MFSTIRRQALIIALAMACGFVPFASARGADQRKTVPTVESSTKLLVTTTGRVVEGQIIPHAGGYMVEMEHGSLFMPFGQVRLQATSRRDAYQKLRNSIPELSANNHVSLARWCISNKLFTAAKNELLDALEFEPNRSDARTMLAKLDNIVNPPAKVEKPKSLEKRLDGYLRGDIESLNGLSRKSGLEFAKRVQPILQNKCSNAGCHVDSTKGSTIPFRLSRNGGRSHRAYAEHNLAEVLKYIDFESPGSSRLLEGMTPGHASSRRVIFGGRAGRTQTQFLRAWIYQVARERQASGQVAESGRGSGKRKANGDAMPTSKAKDAGKTAVRTASAESSSETQNPVRQAVLESVREQAKPDPFDPDFFNRMSGSASANKPKSTSPRLGASK